MSKHIEHKISWIEASPDGFVYTALKDKIVCWKKMHQVMEFEGHDKEVIKFIIAGEFIFSLAEDGEFVVFNRKQGSVNKKIKFDSSFDNFIHPSTYVNKLLFSSGNSLQLWNVMSETMVFDFKREEVSCIE